VLGLDALHAHQRPGLVQNRDDAGEHVAHARLDADAARHLAVDLHDVRAQAPDAVEVRVAGAEIVDHDHAAHLAVILDRGGEARLAHHLGFDQLDRHAVRREAVLVQHVREERAVARPFDRDVRVDVEEQPAARLARLLEVLHVQAAAAAVEVDSGRAARRAAEQLGGRDHRAGGVAGADQAFVADRAAVREAEDRLELARQGAAERAADVVRRRRRYRQSSCA
jgi:hypothetical protein